MQTARKLNLQTVLNRERVTASKGLRNTRKVARGTDQEKSPLPMGTNGHKSQNKLPWLLKKAGPPSKHNEQDRGLFHLWVVGIICKCGLPCTGEMISSGKCRSFTYELVKRRGVSQSTVPEKSSVVA